MTHSDELIIDQALALRLAGNKPDLAREMMMILAESLPTDIAAIKEAYDAANYVELQKRVHKLHGAVCYCGAPRLKRAIANFETALKEEQVASFSHLYAILEAETVQLLVQISEIF